MTSTKVLWIMTWLTYSVTSKKNNIQEKNDYVTFYKIEFSDNGHLKLQNALRLKKNYM